MITTLHEGIDSVLRYTLTLLNKHIFQVKVLVFNEKRLCLFLL